MNWARYWYTITIDPTNSNRMESDYSLVFSRLLSMRARWVDFYTVLQDLPILLHFQGRLPQGTGQDILLYMGDDHAGVIRDFLLTLDFKLVSVSRSKEPNINYQCLELKARYPFFGVSLNCLNLDSENFS